MEGAIHVVETRLKSGDFDQNVSTSFGQTEAKFTLELKTGRTRIGTWLLDKNSKPICSAYYTKVELIK